MVGFSKIAGDAEDHAFSWTQAGGIVDLGTLGGTWSFAVALNSRGQVVGESQSAGGDPHAFSWTRAGGMVDLGTIGGPSSSATAVNDRGRVVGSSDLASGEDHATLWLRPRR